MHLCKEVHTNEIKIPSCSAAPSEIWKEAKLLEVAAERGRYRLSCILDWRPTRWGCQQDGREDQ